MLTASLRKHMSRIDEARRANAIVRRHILDVDKKKGGKSIGQSEGPRIICQESSRATLLDRGNVANFGERGEGSRCQIGSR